jgi:UBX domain-containing protein 1
VELNAEHTVGHLRAFVAAQGAGDEPYDLLAGFPPRPLVDAGQSIADAGLAGGAVSQKLRA